MIGNFVSALAASVAIVAFVAPLSAYGAADNATRKERLEKRSERLGAQFAKLDVDKNGAVDRVEVDRPRERRFGKLDANGDNVIDAAEIEAAREKRAERRAGKPEGRRAAAGDMFERADADKDGKVTKAEFMASPAPWFVRADADKDEKVTVAELDAFRERMANRARKGTTGAE